VVKRVAKDELESENLVRSVARLSAEVYEASRVGILEFLDADAFKRFCESCVSFLEPLNSKSWDIDLARSGWKSY